MGNFISNETLAEAYKRNGEKTVRTPDKAK